MANIKHKISVVTVTYGNRWSFLTQVIQRLLRSDLVYQVIIVNNASSYDVKNKVNELADQRLIVIDHPENLGSAKGYKTGIAYAHQNTDTDFVWLLDDDNLPDENALSVLLKTWDELKAQGNQTALYCFRPDRKTHINIAKGENPYRYYLVPNNFLGFSLTRILYNQFLKLKDKFKKGTSLKNRVTMPYVPYGGLFLHRAMIDKIGYPNEDFFLYVDDSEYTYRITAQGGTIWLIPDCRITDIDQSQGISYQKKLFSSILLDQWNFRTYYHVRNRVFFYKTVALKNQFIFECNKYIFMKWLKLLSILSSRETEYKKFSVAIDDGLKGHLGKADTDKF